ncbi:hypothetical protein [uncultured Gammaproteobacteria bacterium]|jgi:hypothetical protein|nr:hypothetical protein BROOK1789B_1077 [Bathymodiolus brooksi thiotrophic gill symbiont]CAC9539961.1 hypothetical protein [uncultured Gammaproteobacteria bacterium]CAB9542549.1 hypothetical protein BROOK1789C_321 [Bathymodiolus brooksi thiotrophic gill symbiont]CAC9554775.1 hypothetical protein [uncultured Gammaproteobacteria bacterium]CAC9557292.1 hypothetical protein [uncultured Gammaproteobacteria bacterium]
MNYQNKFSIYRNAIYLVFDMESAVKNFVIFLQKGKCFIFKKDSLHKLPQHLQQLIKSSQNDFMQLYMRLINEQGYQKSKRLEKISNFVYCLYPQLRT